MCVCVCLCACAMLGNMSDMNYSTAKAQSTEFTVMGIQSLPRQVLLPSHLPRCMELHLTSKSLCDVR